jgi:hypothetical protein
MTEMRGKAAMLTALKVIGSASVHGGEQCYSSIVQRCGIGMRAFAAENLSRQYITAASSPIQNRYVAITMCALARSLNSDSRPAFPQSSKIGIVTLRSSRRRCALDVHLLRNRTDLG